MAFHSISFQQFLFSIAISLSLGACISTQTTTDKSESYLPTLIDNVHLGQPRQEVLNLRPKAHIVNSLLATPREIYTEDFNNENYTSVYYLFSYTGNRALVEINIVHKTAEAAEKTIKDYFGEQKNAKQNEWHKTLKNGTTIHATWRKEKVFIYSEKVEVKTENSREQ